MQVISCALHFLSSLILQRCTTYSVKASHRLGKVLIMTGQSPWGHCKSVFVQPGSGMDTPTSSFHFLQTSAPCTRSWQVPRRLFLLLWSLVSGVGLAPLSSATSVFPRVRSPYRDSACQYFQTARGDTAPQQSPVSHGPVKRIGPF